VIRIAIDKFVTDDVSLYAIHQKSGVSYTTLHQLQKGTRTDMRVGSVDKLITALRELTGKEVTACDLLEYIPDKPVKSKK
jgi:DNA-binding Xre family transcriptional regulator